MSIPVQLALTVGQTLRSDQLFIEESENKKHFDKNLLKALSPEDRKTCYLALTAIERAQLKDFTEELPPIDERVENLTERLGQVPQPKEKSEYQWFERPFIWVARRVSSFMLWFQNTFLGRVSSTKLYNKVETYLNDFERAQARLVTLRDNGLIATADESLEKCEQDQRNFLIPFKHLVEVHEALRVIDVRMPKSSQSKIQGMENYRLDLNRAWIVETINADVIPFLNFKEVIVEVVSKSSQEVQEYLKDLLSAAQSIEDNEDEVMQKFDEAGKSVTKEMEERFDEGNEHAVLVKNAKEHESALKQEEELLLKKYPSK